MDERTFDLLVGFDFDGLTSHSRLIAELIVGLVEEGALSKTKVAQVLGRTWGFVECLDEPSRTNLLAAFRPVSVLLTERLGLPEFPLPPINDVQEAGE